MFKSHPLTARFLIFVLLPLLATGGAALVHLRKSLPMESGERSTDVPVSGAVRIARDSVGVVYVTAQKDSDAFFAIGYAHAQDRLWQLEVQRRLASGRLSEVFGQSTVQRDAWMRTLGLYEAARAAWPKLSPPARASLTQYAKGVNAWLSDTQVLPPEFIALGLRPEPWSEIDSLAWCKVFALTIGGNMANELTNLIASQYLDRDQLADLVRLGPQDFTAVASADVAPLNRLLEVMGPAGPAVGSNAWVISGQLSDSGAPVLANDPHLGLQVPSLWYVAHLQGDVLDVSGMTLVGLPVVIFGRNRQIAWGGTSLMADVQDLYFEQSNPQQPSLYRNETGWAQFDARTEIIQIKPAFPAALRAPVEPVRLQVRHTRNGPIVSDAIGSGEQPVALRWVALDQDDLSFESFYKLNYATDWASFREAFRFYVAPALNLLYADEQGNIGSLAIGRIPVRVSGRGRLPAPGWTREHQWTGYIPFEHWSQRYNPAQGYIASANDKVVEDDYSYFISDDWAPEHRVRRIEELIEARHAKGELVSLEYVRAMQADTIDLSSRELLHVLKQTPAADEQQTKALRLLSGWAGDMSRDSQAAAIFFTWTRALREELFGKKLQGYWNHARHRIELDALVASTTNEQVVSALRGSVSRWCEQGVAATAQSCVAIQQRSLAHALRELTRLKGSDMSDWHWGDLHPAVYAHMPFSEVAPLAPLFELRIENGGSPSTINVASATYRESVGYEQSFGPGFRQIMQLGGERAIHLYMNSTGQSGNVFSRHYRDMVQPFRDVQYYTLNAGSAPAKSTITIRPR